MPPRIDLTGQKFGRLTVTGYSHTANRKPFWHCVCNCGNTTVVVGESLKSGNTKSCGCLRKEILKEKNTTHGHSHDKLFRVFVAMVRRCCDPHFISYPHYGGRGITVCNEWKTDFQAFYDWAMANGYREDLTIDRIDVNGDYNPQNCRWVTKQEQYYNRRDNHFLTFQGNTLTLKEWSIETNIPYQTLCSRINRSGWSVERALTTPVRPPKKEK